MSRMMSRLASTMVRYMSRNRARKMPLLDGESQEEELGHAALILPPHAPLLSAGEGGEWEMSSILKSQFS